MNLTLFSPARFDQTATHRCVRERLTGSRKLSLTPFAQALALIAEHGLPDRMTRPARTIRPRGESCIANSLGAVRRTVTSTGEGSVPYTLRRTRVAITVISEGSIANPLIEAGRTVRVIPESSAAHPLIGARRAVAVILEGGPSNPLIRCGLRSSNERDAEQATSDHETFHPPLQKIIVDSKRGSMIHANRRSVDSIREWLVGPILHASKLRHLLSRTDHSRWRRDLCASLGHRDLETHLGGRESNRPS